MCSTLSSFCIQELRPGEGDTWCYSPPDLGEGKQSVLISMAGHYSRVLAHVCWSQGLIVLAIDHATDTLAIPFWYNTDQATTSLRMTRSDKEALSKASLADGITGLTR